VHYNALFVAEVVIGKLGEERQELSTQKSGGRREEAEKYRETRHPAKRTQHEEINPRMLPSRVALQAQNLG